MLAVSATGRPAESLWPPADALRDTALLLVGLVLVVLLADGQLVLWLSGVLVVAWWVLGFRRDPDDAPPPLWAVLVPIFIAIILAELIAPNEWSIVALIAIAIAIAIAAPLVVVSRAALVLHDRRSA